MYMLAHAPGQEQHQAAQRFQQACAASRIAAAWRGARERKRGDSIVGRRKQNESPRRRGSMKMRPRAQPIQAARRIANSPKRTSRELSPANRRSSTGPPPRRRVASGSDQQICVEYYLKLRLCENSLFRLVGVELFWELYEPRCTYSRNHSPTPHALNSKARVPPRRRPRAARAVCAALLFHRTRTVKYVVSCVARGLRTSAAQLQVWCTRRWGRNS